MDTLRVNYSNTTLEVLAKIMNSYAVKYDCSVKYNAEDNELSFTGENSHKLSIAYETSEALNVI